MLTFCMVLADYSSAVSLVGMKKNASTELLLANLYLNSAFFISFLV